jgi:hypothetical protein
VQLRKNLGTKPPSFGKKIEEYFWDGTKKKKKKKKRKESRGFAVKNGWVESFS